MATTGGSTAVSLSKVWGTVLTVTSVVACPCHFPVTLPILLGLLGGTGLGGFISSNTGLVYGVAGTYFVVALAAGYWLLSRKAKARGQARELPAQRLRIQLVRGPQRQRSRSTGGDAKR